MASAGFALHLTQVVVFCTAESVAEEEVGIGSSGCGHGMLEEEAGDDRKVWLGCVEEGARSGGFGRFRVGSPQELAQDTTRRVRAGKNSELGKIWVSYRKSEEI